MAGAAVATQALPVGGAAERQPGVDELAARIDAVVDEMHTGAPVSFEARKADLLSQTPLGGSQYRGPGTYDPMLSVPVR